jgi:hemoglobin
MKIVVSILTFLTLLVIVPGCASEEKEDRDFFTSGSREADQRAEQQVAKVQQLRGEGKDGAGDDGDGASPSAKRSLYDRLGGEQGLTMIVNDFVPRAIADPRVNWERKGIKRGGWNLANRKDPVEWKATDDTIAKLKKHMVQFLSVATGGPSTYEGKDIREAHANMHITNAEFDATMGDLKATLDTLGVPTDEQKELLAIVESTRPMIAEKR